MRACVRRFEWEANMVEYWWFYVVVGLVLGMNVGYMVGIKRGSEIVGDLIAGMIGGFVGVSEKDEQA